MKKTFFFFAMFTSVASGAQVAVSNTAVNYATKKITFTVSWTTTPKNNKIWLLADYRKIENNAETGNWSRAPIAAATTTAGIGSASTVAGNTQGFWLNTSGSSGSATVLVTLAMPDEVTKFNWCAYAFDSPPNVVILGNNNYTLHGSRPFEINGTTLPANQTTYSGTIISFTDATGAPGIFPAALGEQTNEMGCVAGFVENTSGVCITPESVGCNNNALNFGTVAFTAGTEITVVGNGVSQIWSRPVTAAGCQKTTFNGGSSVTQSYNVDCRNNPSYSGDLFSFCATFRHAEKLCSPPWRVPSARDFEMLLDAFGLINGAANQQQLITAKMIGLWAAEWNGYAKMDGTMSAQHNTALYATLSTAGALKPIARLQIYGAGWDTSSWLVNVPRHDITWAGGTTMRCVQ
jgi:hypothetical protein